MTLITILALGILAYFLITRTKDTSTFVATTAKFGFKSAQTGVTLVLEARELNKDTDGLLFSDDKNESVLAAAERNADKAYDATGLKDIYIDSMERRGKASSIKTGRPTTTAAPTKKKFLDIDVD